MNSQAAQWKGETGSRCRIMPSVAAEAIVAGTCPPGKADATANRPFVVLSAGRFVPLKGFDLTILAFSSFFHRLPADKQRETRLVLIGSGSQKTLLDSLVDREGIAGNTEFIAWVSRDKMRDIYRSADVCLFPSHEGAGMVVAEAMSYGLPVICLDGPGPGEFVHPQSQLKVCYSTYDQSTQALAGKLDDLLSDRKLFKKEQNLALQRFHQCFDWNRRGDQLKNIYESLCANRVS